MATSDLISNLVRDLQPVRPLPLPWVRVAQWGLLAVASMALVMAVMGPRVDFLTAVATPSFQAHSALLLLAAATSAVAALVRAVPGESLGLWRFAPVAAVLAWAAWLAAELMTFMAGGQDIWPIASGVGCVAKAFAFGVAPGIVLTIMLGRGAPGDARAAMVFAGTAAAAVGALGVEMTCPLISPTHLLLWHAGPVAAIVLAASVFGRATLNKCVATLSQDRR